MSQYIEPHTPEGWRHQSGLQTERIIELTNEVEKFRNALERIAATPLDIYPGEKQEIAQEALTGKASPHVTAEGK